jgi:hypothetical protein
MSSIWVQHLPIGDDKVHQRLDSHALRPKSSGIFAILIINYHLHYTSPPLKSFFRFSTMSSVLQILAEAETGLAKRKESSRHRWSQLQPHNLLIVNGSGRGI